MTIWLLMQQFFSKGSRTTYEHTRDDVGNNKCQRTQSHLIFEFFKVIFLTSFSLLHNTRDAVKIFDADLQCRTLSRFYKMHKKVHLEQKRCFGKAAILKIYAPIT